MQGEQVCMFVWGDNMMDVNMSSHRILVTESDCAMFEWTMAAIMLPPHVDLKQRMTPSRVDHIVCSE